MRIRTRRLMALGFGLAVAGGVAAAVLPPAAAGAKEEADKAAAKIETGPNKGLGGKLLFPPDDPWNTDISKEPVDPNSDALVASIGLNKRLHPDFGTVYDGHPNGIPYVIVAGDQPKVPVTFEYKDESDPGPYPIPANA